MKGIKKIPSFTLTEMLVALAISSIVVGLAYTIISLFTRNIGLIQENYSASTKTDLFEQQLTIDFHRYTQIRYDNTSETLYLKTPIDSIVYLFQEAVILRDADTILKQQYQKSFYNLGDQISHGTIDALKIEFIEKEKHSFLFFYKEADALKYMNAYGN